MVFGLSLGCLVSYNDGLRGVAQWLARHVRDVEAGGSNPLTPTLSYSTTDQIGEQGFVGSLRPDCHQGLPLQPDFNEYSLYYRFPLGVCDPGMCPESGKVFQKLYGAFDSEDSVAIRRRIDALELPVQGILLVPVRFISNVFPIDVVFEGSLMLASAQPTELLYLAGHPHRPTRGF